MIEALLTYLKTCPHLAELKRLKVDFLSAEPGNGSIETIPLQEPIIRTWIGGGGEYRYMFYFKARFLYSEEVTTNIANINFFENFQKWLDDQSENGNLPVLSDDCTATKIRAIGSGYLASNPETMDNAEYAIQCELIYEKEA
jgi:hypothetical protein